MSTISRICENESQPGLQLVEKLAMPLEAMMRWAEDLNKVCELKEWNALSSA